MDELNDVGIIHMGTWTMGYGTLCEEMSGELLPKPETFTEDESLVTCQSCLEWLHA